MTTTLEKENGMVTLQDLYAGEETAAATVSMPLQQFVQLLDDWEEKVCKRRPKDVVLVYTDGRYSIET